MGSWIPGAFLSILLFVLVQGDVYQCRGGCGKDLSRKKKSIDLNSAHGLISETRLPREVTPNSYRLELHPIPEEGTFKGRVRLNVTWQETSKKITLHAHPELHIDPDIVINQISFDDETDKSSTPQPPLLLKIVEQERMLKKPIFIITLDKTLKRGTQCEVDIKFNGKLLNETIEGFFRSSYVEQETNEKKWFVATHMRPNVARRVFPCFDEPAYKVPFIVSVARHKNMTAMSNMPVDKTEEMPGNPAWVWDHFQETPPMSTFTFGLVVSNFECLNDNYTKADNIDTEIRVWGRRDFLPALANSTQKVTEVLLALQRFWGVPYPLPKLDVIALPNYQAVRPADNWGLILFKESELSGKGTWPIAQELAYQWLGAFATPFWWSDAHLNKALASYLAAFISLELDSGQENTRHWPMTVLYSIYYEFSKRYPHARITGIKQESISVKTELVFRMLNYTLGERTFKHGMQRFMNDRQYKTFFGDDVWGALTEQARFDSVLDRTVSVNEIAASWITKDRLPVVNVTRNYRDKTAVFSQRVYLRERPHDVPDQSKYLWWIPIVLVRHDKLNFTNSTPIVWMRKEKEIVMDKMPGSEHFIIVNPEEIGPFPVNYDVHNWNLLATYLQTDERTKVPVMTRAKLLHDAWNLAYAGDLSFATALNMTLFLKNERHFLAWDPIFTMIDHIGRHIDSSAVHKKFEMLKLPINTTIDHFGRHINSSAVHIKFEMYVRNLLTPLYEELGDEPKEGECEGKEHLRALSKVFLCRAGYPPCITEAQAAYNKWMIIENPDEGNPVANQYICPVFKWGTREEWEFGLQRVINFPADRKQSERTYLLKTLAGCPIESWKIERLLNITVLEANGNFTENDVHLIFSMLTGGANGYMTLFGFLNDHWDSIKQRFEGKNNLWDSLITSATTVFKTQEGLDMVNALYSQRKGEFGTAEHIVERALRNIKEETKWSNDNLPVIEKWLDEYLKNNNVK